METIWTAFLAYLGWHVLPGVVVFAVLFLIVLIWAVRETWRQSRCAHSGGLMSAGLAGTEQRCVHCGKFICHTWDLPKRDAG